MIAIYENPQRKAQKETDPTSAGPGPQTDQPANQSTEAKASQGQMNIPIGGLDLQVRHNMIGAKRAIKIGRNLHVSPAMHSLISNARDQDELIHVLHHIKVVDISRYSIPVLTPLGQHHHENDPNLPKM